MNYNNDRLQNEKNFAYIIHIHDKSRLFYFSVFFFFFLKYFNAILNLRDFLEIF